jgi:asparagine synthase (glutamine-hydrolysing)
MCGITGILAFNLVGKFNRIHVTNATMALEKRGPDFQDIYTDEWVGLGHRRLSIIDTRSVANQPMWDDQERYCIIFNGEIFNFRELRAGLIAKGISFRTESDTEVLLKLYLSEGEACLNKLNGFFAFAIYDKQEESLFVARDRFGVKPLLYVYDEDKFIFASEMKAMMQYGLEKSIDYNSLYLYLQLNYIPAPDTIFTNIKKLLPGHYIKVSRGKIEIQRYYHIPYDHNAAEKNKRPYADVQREFNALLETAVLRRLVSDVPLGAFLSGGIDSSVVTALAARHKPDLHTFSIGFRDEKFFDETHYAQLVAKKFKTQHTVFSLTNDDLYRHLHDILNYIDEPFADSSAIAVYILSRETRKHATVALSGDGADELLSGYNKHAAHYRVMHPGVKEGMVSAFGPFWKMMPKSRNGTLSNKFRQLARFAEGMKLAPKERYWQWATFASNEDALRMLHPELRINKWLGEYVQRRKNILQSIPDQENMNDILYTDMQLVLPNDMLTKVDLMSMANGLEVRTPFLDVDVVNYAFRLPSSYKINHKLRKRVLQDAFRKVLPSELYNRPKKGFEVPLLKWFRRELKGEIMNNWLSEKFIREQSVFDYAEIKKLKEQLFSSNPGDVHARIWGLIVFQSWWKKNIG